MLHAMSEPRMFEAYVRRLSRERKFNDTHESDGRFGSGGDGSSSASTAQQQAQVYAAANQHTRDAMLRSAYAGWQQKLTAQQHSAFGWWTGEGMHEKINTSLRGGWALDRTTGESEIPPARIAYRVQTALLKGSSPFDITTRRGIDGSLAESLIPPLVGDTSGYSSEDDSGYVDDSGYGNTPGGESYEDHNARAQQALFDLAGKSFVDKGFAATTAASGEHFGNTKLVITIPQGSAGAYIAPLSGHIDEMEFLLPAGTTYSVQSAGMEGIFPTLHITADTSSAKVIDYQTGLMRKARSATITPNRLDRFIWKAGDIVWLGKKPAILPQPPGKMLIASRCITALDFFI